MGILWNGFLFLFYVGIYVGESAKILSVIIIYISEPCACLCVCVCVKPDFDVHLVL